VWFQKELAYVRPYRKAVGGVTVDFHLTGSFLLTVSFQSEERKKKRGRERKENG
jgi:hypothetical protein